MSTSHWSTSLTLINDSTAEFKLDVFASKWKALHSPEICIYVWYLLGMGAFGTGVSSPEPHFPNLEERCDKISITQLL